MFSERLDPTNLEVSMQKWELANLQWEGTGMGKKRYVEFTHRPRQDKLHGDQLYQVMHDLGEDGFELVGQVSVGGWNSWWFKRPLEDK
jgi:hypothetical protein